MRGTTRSPVRLPELEAAGIEGVVADPDRLETLTEHLVDTPVRGFVYEAAGSVDQALLERGAHIVRTASRTWHMPVEVVTVDPASHEDWVEAIRAAVGKVLSV